LYEQHLLTTIIAARALVAVATGTLYAQGKIGVPGSPVTFLNVDNATIRLNVDGSVHHTNSVVDTITQMAQPPWISPK